MIDITLFALGVLTGFIIGVVAMFYNFKAYLEEYLEK